MDLDEFWNQGEGVGHAEHVGVDAGRNYAILRGNVLAVVDAGAMGSGGLLAHREFVDFLVPPGHPEVRVTNFDVILKTKVVLELLMKDLDVPVLVDGSYESDVSKPRWGRLNISVDALSQYDPASHLVLSQEVGEEVCGGADRNCFTELEFAEKLYLLREVSRIGKAVYVSKSTDANELSRRYLGEGLHMTDLDLLYSLNPPPGYTDPLGRRLVCFPGTGQPIGEVDVFYLRLAPRGPILRVEVFPGSWEPQELFQALRGRQMDGYPFWLARIDREVRVTRRDLQNVLTLLGLEYVPSGREVLL